MPLQDSTTPTPAPGPRPARRAILLLAWLLFIAGLAESSARAFWRIRFGIPLRGSDGIATAFYDGLRPVLAAAPGADDGILDVLLLGGSTVTRPYGEIPQVLTERLSAATRRPVRIHNLGMKAHTSRDSWYKYRALDGVRFDLVVLYDGFNEVRANNVPPALFHEDYSHFDYYALANDVLGAGRLRPFALPYTLRYARRRLGAWRAARAGAPITVPMDRPDSAWVRFGSDVRTAAPFRRNVEAILDLAAARREPVIVLTFAAYFAPGYTEAAFRARRLDYTTHHSPVEVWGTPASVAAGLAAHNATLRAIHAARPDVGFVDLDAAMPRGREYFNDVCHFTVAGSVRFVDALMPTALTLLGPRWTAGATDAGP